MPRAVLMLALATLAGASTLVAQAQADAAAQPEPLAAFARFLGPWLFPEEMVAQTPQLADFFAERAEWGPKRATIRLGETVHKRDPGRYVFEGLAYWHPVDGTIRFTGYNVQERFLFEGEYVVLEPGRLVREYRVSYPAEYEFPLFKELKQRVRIYRGERTLRDDDTLEVKTFLRVGTEWQRWPAPDAKPFVMKRARATPE